jgi:alcohol dehydrogenase (cytochrome c)
LVVGFVFLAPAGIAHADAQAEWPSYNRSQNADRFSPLARITPKNAADLREVCEVSLGDPGALQSGPLMVGDTLFITTTHTVVAVNAADCSLRWRSVYEAQEDEIWPVNRGAAYMDGKLFRGTGDGRLLAIDAANGKEIWRVKIADPAIGEFLSGAPAAWNGLVYAGPSGGDWGTQGRISAFDATTGKEVWRFNSIPLPGEPGYETWHIPETAKHGGGGTWTSFTLDAAAGEFFAPVSNPAPAYRADTRPGENLYTDSMVVLDAKTGALKWYYQLDPNEGFDYDLAATPVLYTDKTGKRRVALGSKDGYLYILDRNTHKLISKTAITTIKNPPTQPTPAGVYACPGTDGGVEWNGPAYSSATNLVYVGSVDWCWYFFSGEARYTPTLSYMGNGPAFKAGKNRSGWVYGVNASTGKPVWRHHTESPVLSGVTPTAGGVVFSGESSGNLLVFDARSGALLKKQNLGGSLGGGVITYGVGAKQYVATTAGNVSRAGLSSAGDFTPRLIVMTTGLEPSYQATKVAAFPPEEAGRLRFGVDQGKAIYSVFCASCHGMGGKGGAGAPALQDEASRKSLDEVIQWIKNPAPPMPKLSPPLMDSEVDAVGRYVEQLKSGLAR